MRKPDLSKVHSNDPTGIQNFYRFPNNYGASVIKSQFSYGGRADKWELAVLRYKGKEIDSNFELDYTTPVTGDVEGYLTEEDVDRLLNQIEALPAKEAIHANQG